MSLRALKLCCGLLLCAAVLLTFIPCIANDFVSWDDYRFVVENFHIASLSGDSLKWMATTFYQSAWHPLTWLSHAADRALWGLKPSYHHLVNVVLHTLNAVLFYALGLALFARTGRGSTAALVAAFSAALLWGLHPLRVESVAWVAERKDVLCAFFFLVSVLAYLAYGAEEESRTRRRAYIASVVFAALALLSKPMAISLPLLLLVIDYYPLERLDRASALDRVREKIPFFVLAAGAALLNILASAKANVPWSYVPLGDRIMNASYSILAYIRLSIFPQDLVPLYQFDRSVDYFGPAYVFSLIAVVLITGLCLWRAWNRDKVWAAVWFSYLVMLTPALGLAMSYRHAMADRYTYLPTLGLWLLAGVGIGALWERAGKFKPAAGVRAALVGIVALVAVIYASLSVDQIRIWKNSETLWRHIVENADYKPAIAFCALGKELEKKGEYAEALDLYRTAYRLNPANTRYLSDIAGAMARLGQTDEALRAYDRILEAEPRNAQVHVDKGRVLALIGRMSEAQASFETAVSIAPDYPQALGLLAMTHLNQGDLAKARAYYDKYLATGYPPVKTLSERLGMPNSRR